ncbi:MAG: hypothetical protein HDS67_01165 [Bacteroidales bacterium]|nr:hypothetical protein [Bacteroidales bacterium]
MEEDKRPPLPDCTNCAGCGTTGGACGGCSRRAGLVSDDDAETPLPKCGACGGCGSVDGFRGEPRGKLAATNWLDDISTSADFPAVQVQFKNTRNGFYSNPQKLNLEIGDIVAVEAQPGHDIGRVVMVGPLVRNQMIKAKVDPEKPEALKRIFRKARQSDLERFDQARAREHETMIRSRRIAEELGLNMKIGDVEFQGDGAKAIFYYIADERVDFRKLIRLLADEFKVRIEMKQIGARQEAGRIGGIGPCGRPLCCSSWMSHFVSVGTGAARMQDLSMNPQKLAGQCAKLKCCLNFEIDAYAESSRKLPPKDVHLYTKDQEYYHFKVDILSRMVTYSSDPKMAVNLVTIPASRAFEIIALNKQGVKPDALDTAKPSEPERPEFIDLTDQDDLTRFDKSKRKKKAKKPQGQKTRDNKPHAEKPRDSKPRPENGQPRPKNRERGPEPRNIKDRPQPQNRPHDRRKVNPQRHPQQNRPKSEGKGNES